jgi:uncharacterized protein
MSLRDTINDAVKTAMREKNKSRLTVLRMLTAAIKQREVDERITLDEAQVQAVVEKMVKQRRDSVNQYQQANRPELAEAEQAEIVILTEFLPEQLSEAEITELVQSAINESGAAAIGDIGNVMAILKPKLRGRADMGLVSKTVRQQLAG